MKISSLVIKALLCFTVFFPEEGISQKIDITGRPPYEIIVAEFISKYSVPNIYDPEALQFAHKRDGWWVKSRLSRDDLFSEQLFWSVEDRTYKELDLPASGVHQVNTNYFLSDNQIRQYRIHPFYGYENWHADVIKVFEGYKNDLTDDLLYGLCRSYGAFGLRVLNINEGKRASLEEPDPYIDSLVPLSDSITGLYVEFENKACDCYELLKQKNPTFQTFIGQIDLKQANEYADTYLHLMAGQRKKEAMDALAKASYPSYLLSSARNYLSSCDSNAILFTNGDNDTFPLWYVQQIEGFRRDVDVINITLLNADWYVSGIRRGDLFSGPSPFSIPNEIHADKGIDYYIFPEENNNEIHDFEKLLAEISRDELSKKDGEIYKNMRYFPGRKLSIKVANSDSTIWNGWDEPITDEIELNLIRPYLYQGHVLQLDLIANQIGHRPIHFAASMPRNSYFNLGDYMRQTGFSYRLVTNKSDESSPGQRFGYLGQINESFMHEALLNKFVFDGFYSESSLSDENHQRFITNHHLIYITLAQGLMNNGENDKAISVLDYCLDKLPFHSMKKLPVAYSFAEIYFDLEEFQKANELAERVFEEGFNQLVEAYGNDRDLTKDETNTLNILYRIVNLTDKYGDKKVKKEFSKKIKKISGEQ